MWAIRRVAGALLLVLVVVSAVFLTLRAVPGDPAVVLLSRGGGSVDPDAVVQLRKQLGLDQPLLVQYAGALRALAHGDLGVSMQDGASVSEQIERRLPRTIELVAFAALFSLVSGIPLGLLAAIRAGGMLDQIAGACAGLAVSIPNFIIGTLFVLVFANKLHLVPAGGYVPFAAAPWRHLALVAMPAATSAVGLFATVFRMTRGAVADIAGRDYVVTARAKGLTRTQILLSHVLRNALTPIVTTVALSLGVLLGNAVLVEYVFNYPGLSGLLIEAVNARDYTMVQGVVLVISILFVAINLTVELTFAALDPRMREA